MSFGVFFVAAFTLAVIPGPGMLYVLARTLRGGRREGLLSTLGTGVAGVVHTVAAALGVSAVLASSALAFMVIKYLGAAYLVYLGVRMILESGDLDAAALVSDDGGHRGAFVQGLMTEVLNPKTALFFLAFIPQFIDVSAGVFWQFVLLGVVTTLLTSGADFVVVLLAGRIRGVLQQRAGVRRAQRLASGVTLLGLGVYVAVER